jgi:hypothetical protein
MSRANKKLHDTTTTASPLSRQLLFPAPRSRIDNHFAFEVVTARRERQRQRLDGHQDVKLVADVATFYVGEMRQPYCRSKTQEQLV